MLSLDHARHYEKVRPQYERFTKKLAALLDELLKAKGLDIVLDSRTKSIASFAEKLSRPEKNYEDPLREITDLSGVRVIVRSLSDALQVEELIDQEFAVDADRSIRKRDHFDDDRFGYLSDHYIVTLKEPRKKLQEWNGLAELSAEIQVRTILQHAWASVQYSLDYKSSYDIPKKLRRRLYRLSALFELADEELNQIGTDAKALFANYSEQVRIDPKDVELNVDSLKAYLEKSPSVEYWLEFIQRLGVAVGAIGMISRDVTMAKSAGLTTIGQIDGLLNGARSWGESYLRDFFHNTFGNPVPPIGCSMDRNGVVTLFLIGEFQSIFDNETLDNEFGWGKPERATVPARKYNLKS